MSSDGQVSVSQAKRGKQKCWVCGSASMGFFKASDVEGKLTSQSFAITDSDYGHTGELYKCRECGFLQCTDIRNALSFYEELEDEEYEAGRAERALQARKLLELVAREKPSGRLVDIGAGSGILVEQAIARGYLAEGVEPSRWLQEQATSRGLPVHVGEFPHEAIETGIDVVMLVDVIEHVSNPVSILRRMRECMADNGIGLVVTPDVGSLAARFLGTRWWHFRFAHIGYFDKKTLLCALKRAGLEPIRIGRPKWYFPVDYLLERVNHYLPSFLRLPAAPFLNNIVIPLNLRDSLYVLFRKSDGYQTDDKS